jgi:RNA polymerase sigma-70 factor (ECF subfamily)
VAAGQGEFDDALAGALEELDETARACLLMRVVLDLPYKRIALALDIPEGTAASHVHRARASMRASLKSGGGAAAERGVRA